MGKNNVKHEFVLDFNKIMKSIKIKHIKNDIDKVINKKYVARSLDVTDPTLDRLITDGSHIFSHIKKLSEISGCTFEEMIKERI